MTYKRFEDLPVWNKAIELADSIYDMVEDHNKTLSFSFRDQIERAALSVSNNIAEGFERGTTNELLAYLYIASGSAGEVRSMLRFIQRRKRWKLLHEHAEKLIPIAESCSRQLSAWMSKLQNSEIKGR